MVLMELGHSFCPHNNFHDIDGITPFICIILHNNIHDIDGMWPFVLSFTIASISCISQVAFMPTLPLEMSSIESYFSIYTYVHATQRINSPGECSLEVKALAVTIGC